MPAEKNLEETIETALLDSGYTKRTSQDYDRSLCLIPDDVINFICATQPKEWKKLKKHYGENVKNHFLARLSKQIKQKGPLEILRKPFKDYGCTFKLVYFRPNSTLNPDLQKLYKSNFFTIVRQLHYSEKTNQSLDLVVFLNGLPIFTAELKNPLTGQNVKDAIVQYQNDRDPNEPLFALSRCLAHFAVDTDLVYVTTDLQGKKTDFLPFNQGRNRGARNPPSAFGFATAYLWKRFWSKDSILNLLQHFIHVVEDENDKGHKTGKRALIFPRYHQLDTVRRLVDDAREKGTAQRYLIQHSAGSGKSNSIAWLAHQLAVLQDENDQRVFNSIIVITDRRVLDRQLQHTVRQFEQTRGMVENIDKTSRQLKAALEDDKNIIVTTLQKFPVIMDEIGELSGSRFAVIIDEAHSSQSGEMSKSLKAVLAPKSLADAEEQDSEAEKDNLEDRIVEEVRKRQALPNVSYFAFTATPKPRTLELFGIKRQDGKYEPFSLYSMRQAIEEGFILDVLENYTTYITYFNLLKTIEHDPRYDKKKAEYLLKSFVDLHEHTIDKKVTIMLEHFHGHVAYCINSKAKAMIVTRSRLHTVRYKLAVDKYLKEKSYFYRSLVAFSGEVTDPDNGEKYTETGMNSRSAGKRISEKATAETFKQKEYRILVVADKFQTGFDQPLLHTMYVDKKLGGVHAVQALSRLNRTHPGKKETMVLDFANDADQIQKAFEPYYEETLLSEGTDPNLLYEYQYQLAEFHLYTEYDINRFARIYYHPKLTEAEREAQIHAILDLIVENYEKIEKDEQSEFRSKLRAYTRLYAFLSQIIPFVDTELEKLYWFSKYLRRKLPISQQELPVEIKQQVDLETYRSEKTWNGKIELERGVKALYPRKEKDKASRIEEELEMLSKILQEFNNHFGTDFTEKDRTAITQLEERLDQDKDLANTFRAAASAGKAQVTFDHFVEEILTEMIRSHFKFYKQVKDDADFARQFLSWLFKRYRKRNQKDKNV